MTLLISYGVAPLIATLCVTGSVIIAILWVQSHYLITKSDAPEPFRPPSGIVKWLALLAGIAFLIEGAIMDWGALLMIERAVFSMEQAAVGYIAFSITMVIGRLSGDYIVPRIGRRAILLGGGTLVVLGLIAITTLPSPALNPIGFAVIGLGAATLSLWCFPPRVSKGWTQTWLSRPSHSWAMRAFCWALRSLDLGRNIPHFRLRWPRSPYGGGVFDFACAQREFLTAAPIRSSLKI